MFIFEPAKSFFNIVNDMPKEFFTLYNELRDKGVSHETADRAAREAVIEMKRTCPSL